MLVVLAGNHANFTCDKERWGWQVALSRNKITFRPCIFILWLKECSHSSIKWAVFQAFLLLFHMTGSPGIFKFLKQRGFAALPITTSFSKSPLILPHTRTVSLSLDILPPTHRSPFCAKVLLGRARKKKFEYAIYSSKMLVEPVLSFRYRVRQFPLNSGFKYTYSLYYTPGPKIFSVIGSFPLYSGPVIDRFYCTNIIILE